MKRYLCITSCVACLALLLAMGYDKPLTAKNSSTPSFNQPIKVLGVKLDTTNSQPKTKSKATASWLDSLAVEILNTSGKKIRYLVIHVELPMAQSEGTPLRLPFWYGQPPVPNSTSGEFQIFPPGEKATLKATKNVCDRMRKQLLDSGRVPEPSRDIQTSIDFVVFEDQTSWSGGQIHYPDPANPLRWISAEELARQQAIDSRALTVSYAKAKYNASNSLQPCYRHVGFELLHCCQELYVGSKTFTDDPNGHTQPNLVEACCSPGDCCSYYEVQGCS